MKSVEPSTRRVAVVYHFFAHYRSAVIHALSRDPRCEWTFCGDTADPENEGIVAARLAEDVRFRRIHARRLRPNILWQSGAMGVALDRRYDTLVLLGNPKNLAMWPTALLGRLTGKRVLFWTHGWTYRPTGVLRLVRNAFYRLGHGLLLYGHWAKALGIEQGFDPAGIHVIGNSLDFEAQSRVYDGLVEEDARATRLALFGDPDARVVTWSGRLAAAKRLDLLIEALALLARRGRTVSAVMIGDGPERPMLERLARERGVRVHFEGACYDEGRIARLIYASSVTVSPGPVGLTALHSLAFGTPVVTHDDPERQAPEFESVIPGVTGSLYRSGSLDSLADAIEEWIDERGARQGTRERCRAIVERLWSPAYQVEALVWAVQQRPAFDVPELRQKVPAEPRQAADGEWPTRNRID